MKENQSGRTMLEMLGVLGIMGVLSVGGIAGYGKAIDKYKTNKLIEEVSSITSNVRSIKIRTNSFNGLTNTSAIKLKVIPEEYISGTTIKTPFTGTINIQSAKCIKTNKCFSMVVSNITKNACINLATQDWGKSLVVVSNQALNANFADSLSDTVHNTTQTCTKNGNMYYCNSILMTVANATTNCKCSSNTCSFAIVGK